MTASNEIKVDYIDHMGSDLTVVNAARVSFDKESEYEWVESGVKGLGIESYQTLSAKDTSLIQFLAKHRHTSPFGHCFLSFRVDTPIFSRSQLVKHKFLRVNEISRRYVDDGLSFYRPDVWRARNGNKKQGSHDYPVEDEWVARLMAESSEEEAVRAYESLLGMNVAPEIARSVLPQSLMTSFYWSGSLDAFADMANLRLKPDSQYESRLVAQKIDCIASDLFPVSWKALVNDPS